MLKQNAISNVIRMDIAAASARLCVETSRTYRGAVLAKAAASARLCVETSVKISIRRLSIAAASARLCVETHKII